MQIEVQVTNEARTLTLIVPDTEKLYIFMPSNIAPFTGFCYALDGSVIVNNSKEVITCYL